MTKVKNILSIAGSDPSGGAGIQADLKTIFALSGYGMAVITSLTAQNTQGVTAVQHVDAGLVEKQLRAVFEDIQVDAVKIGMIGSLETAQVITKVLQKYNSPHIVLDPVMVATSGDVLVSDEVINTIKDDLFPLCDVVTPNLPEAEMLRAAEIKETAVLVKGGHGKGDTVTDILYIDGEEVQRFTSPRINTKNTHGTGCTLSSAIATYLAQGHDLSQAIERARTYLIEAIKHADELSVGSGHGPVNHLWAQS